MRRTLLSLLAALWLSPALLLAQSQPNPTLTYGSWFVALSSDKKDFVAYTFQDDDKILGYRCFTSQASCAHIIVTANTRTSGNNYPILINSSSGSYMVSCASSNNHGRFELLPTDFDGFHKTLVDSKGYVGFAIPLESGQFKVIRFSLDGAKEAMSATEAAVRRDSAEYK
jgi:hypothetical protein